jgi:glutaredoxin
MQADSAAPGGSARESIAQKRPGTMLVCVLNSSLRERAPHALSDEPLTFQQLEGPSSALGEARRPKPPLRSHGKDVGMATHEAKRSAVLYRMVTPQHLCPFGLKAKHLLERRGFVVDDRPLRSRTEQDAFKAEHDVRTTPQVFIDGRRVGGYDDLRRSFGLAVKDPKATSYQPVIAVFGVAALTALAASHAASGSFATLLAAEWFVSFSMCILALLKLQDIESFSRMFLGYDLLARRRVPYSYVYPFAELTAGVLMTAHALPWLSVPLALFIGAIGAVSVFKAVYLDKRELKCACVGGGSNVPLGFVSLTENLMMIAMALWMGVRMF